MSSKQQSAPKQDTSGVGQKAGVGKVQNHTKSEEDGENRLLTENEFMERRRLFQTE